MCVTRQQLCRCCIAALAGVWRKTIRWRATQTDMRRRQTKLMNVEPNCLQYFSGQGFVLCWLFADNKFAPGLHNSAFHCPRLIMGSNQCSEFKAQLRFSRGFFQCYKCCVPHLTPFKHPPNSTGCNLPDIIKPVAFEIFFLTRGCGQMYSANWGCEVITLTPFGATVAG